MSSSTWSLSLLYEHMNRMEKIIVVVFFLWGYSHSLRQTYNKGLHSHATLAIFKVRL